MQNKYYVLCFTPDFMVVPVKRDRNPYTGVAWYCGGCPQFFGGAPKVTAGVTETPPTALRRETREESQDRIRLLYAEPFWGYPDPAQDTRYWFYRAGRDYPEPSRTGFAFVGEPRWNEADRSWPLADEGPAEQREMSRLVRVDRTAFADVDRNNRGAVRERLIQQTGARNALKLADFRAANCHTAEAFFRFVQWWYPPVAG